MQSIDLRFANDANKWLSQNEGVIDSFSGRILDET